MSQSIKDELYSEIRNFEELIKVAGDRKDIELKHDLVNNVSLIKFGIGQIDISFNDRLNKNFIRNLSEKLFQWTGRRWIITLAKQIGEKTVNEKKTIEKNVLIENFKKTDFYINLIKLFPDGKLTDIKKED